MYTKHDKSVESLREENELLRQAAKTFGELAERLARELRAIRSNAQSGTPPHYASDKPAPTASGKVSAARARGDIAQAS